MKAPWYGHYASREDVLQNLRDAGCDEELIRCFCHFEAQGQTACQLRLLQQQRLRLLEQIHREEKQIDCLDYLAYHIQKSAT